MGENNILTTLPGEDYESEDFIPAPPAEGELMPETSYAVSLISTRKGPRLEKLVRARFYLSTSDGHRLVTCKLRVIKLNPITGETRYPFLYLGTGHKMFIPGEPIFPAEALEGALTHIGAKLTGSDHHVPGELVDYTERVSLLGGGVDTIRHVMESIAYAAAGYKHLVEIVTFAPVPGDVE